MSLDFKRATDLFLSSEEELAVALGIPVGDVREYRQNPERAPERVMLRLGKVLAERGSAMKRVGELLTE